MTKIDIYSDIYIRIFHQKDGVRRGWRDGNTGERRLIREFETDRGSGEAGMNAAEV